MLDGTLLNGWDRSGPFWLSDVTIILPPAAHAWCWRNCSAPSAARRCCPTSALLAARAPRRSRSLPPVDGPATLAAATPLERRLTLSRLVRQFAISAEGFASPPNASELLWLSNSLGTLIDDLIIEGVDIGKLGELVPEDLAENWQDVLRFLEPALGAWPEDPRGSWADRCCHRPQCAVAPAGGDGERRGSMASAR